MSVSTPTFPAQTTNSSAVTGVEDAYDQYVRIRVGELEFAIGTESLSGVFQVSNQNRLTGNGTVLTANGEYPLCDLAKILQENLGVEVDGTSAQALVALERDGQMGMVLADSVSRPIRIGYEHVHPMPGFCFQRRRESKLLRSVVNFNPELEDSAASLRFVIDSDAILGAAASKKSRPNLLPQQAVYAMMSGGNEMLKRSNQLLDFIPVDIDPSAVEHKFCLPLSAVAEVITPPATLNTLGANEVFQGYALWRTVPVPVVRLGKVFGFASSEQQAGGQRLIVVRGTKNRFVGIYARPQIHTMTVPESAPGDSKLLTGRPFLGCFSTELGELVVPDIDRVLSNDF